MTQSDTAMSDDQSDDQVKVNGRPLDEVKQSVLAAAKRMYAARPGRGHGRERLGSGRRRHRGRDAVVARLRGDDPRRPGAGRPSTARWSRASGRPPPRRRVHLCAFAAYPEVGGVVHCHAKYASMYAVAHRPIPAAIDEFIVYIGGEVPICDYFASGSDGLGPEVASKLADRSAALMANHGLVAIGKSVDDALHSAMVVEHNAHIFWGAASSSAASSSCPRRTSATSPASTTTSASTPGCRSQVRKDHKLSAIASWIHGPAWVENPSGARQSKASAARSSPKLASWMRTLSDRPGAQYD